MTDREKFQAWLIQCPVTVYKVDTNFERGWIDITVQCKDEEDEDWRSPWENGLDK
jgi:hypothetical protein